MAFESTTKINEKFPWLCSSMKEYDVGCCDHGTKNTTESEANLDSAVTIEGLNLFGLQCVYYYVTHDISYDVVLGEDQLEYIARAFNFIGYIQQMPSNVRTYQLQGIWGEDLLQMFVANPAFRYFSTYGGSDRNTPEIYDQIIPRIGDIIYLPQNKTFYEIRDVKYYSEAFGLKSHTYTLTLKVYKDTKCTVSADNPTLADPNDPIYKVASYPLSAQNEYYDPLQQNDELETLEESKNVNYFNYIYDETKLS